MKTYHIDWATFKPLWIEALRSGKYTQGNSRLRDREGGYCCLGVACDLVTKLPYLEGFMQWVETYKKEALFLDVNNHNTNYLLIPKSIQFDGLPKHHILEHDSGEEYGIQVEIPYNLLNKSGIDSFCKTTLADLNDVHEFTFEQIADVIEKYLP